MGLTLTPQQALEELRVNFDLFDKGSGSTIAIQLLDIIEKRLNALVDPILLDLEKEIEKFTSEILHLDNEIEDLTYKLNKKRTVLNNLVLAKDYYEKENKNGN